MRNERTQRMLQSALERQSGVQNYVFGDLTGDLRLRRERCAHAALKRLILGKHHVRVLTCAGCSAITLDSTSVMALAQATECNPPPLILPVRERILRLLDVMHDV